ncbi:AAA family ATPase [Paludibaculum fermentans]|uniref:AAA family ATPase n=1 Tax=Paludibaculum fermentans TaxID=1473598 RepID=A0A7S7NKJ4_PALFE|nr:AAA family ATPase [Paludibaculum fermentans]QOY85353.1 AAA family ATPase [Paludibaculum fermentans]
MASIHPPSPDRAAKPHELRLQELTRWVLSGSPGQFLGLQAPRGILLSGPPGCGKTRLVRTAAMECGAAFFPHECGHLLDQFYRDGVGGLTQVFDEARAHPPSILFLSDVEMLAPRLVFEQGRAELPLVAHLLKQVDCTEAGSRVFLVAASSKPNTIAQELRSRGRLDREIVMPVPDRVARKEILEACVRSLPVEGVIDLESLARITSGFTGADLASICEEAVLAACRHQREQPRLRMDHFLMALRVVEGTARGEVFLETPNARWSGIGGLEPQKQRLRELIEWPIRHAEAYVRAGVSGSRGVLLSGPSGVGKTLLARAVASESGAGFLALHGKIFHAQHEDPAGTLREAFRRVRQSAPCILFLDHVEDLMQSYLSQHLLAEMSALAGLRGIVVLGATSCIDRLDPALLGTGFFDEIIEIPLPAENERREILELLLASRTPKLQADLDYLARSTQDFTGEDLLGLCNRASRLALLRVLGAGAPGDAIPQPADFEAGLDELRRRRRRHFV